MAQLLLLLLGMILSKAKTKNRPKFVSERLLEKTERLVSGFLKGKEPSILGQYARILDEYFRESFETSTVGPRMTISKNPYAIIALGGYGRQEQCIHSDVDLLFLFKKRIPGEAEDLIREIIYPLWDLGLDIGYATRSLKECIDLAAKDFEVLIPLFDARFICGMSFLYSGLLEKLREKIILKRSGRIIKWLLRSNQERHVRFGDSTYLLETNLKESQGGLRDYHTMLWIAKVKYNLMQPGDLEYFGCLSHNEFQDLTQALAFIWNVRNRLHYLSGRKCDQLHFEYQLEIADALNFKEKDGQQAVEIFLGKLHGMMELVKEQQMMFLNELGYLKKKGLRRKSLLKQGSIDGLYMKKDMLNFNSSEEILKSPELLFKIFESLSIF
jgi:[protein-PII] uridylyltransferase